MIGLNPWAILGGVLLWIASLVAVGLWQHEAGQTAERVAWQERENKQLTDAANRIKELNETARKAEADHAANLDALATHYEGKLKDEEARRRADVDRARAGSIVLRDPHAPAVPACAGGTAEAGTATGQRDGAEGGRLSGEAAAFLLNLTHDANVVAWQLTEAQGVIREYQRVCGKSILTTEGHSDGK